MHETNKAGGDEELPRGAADDPTGPIGPAGPTGRTGPGEGADAAEAVRRPAGGSQAEQDAIFAALVAQFDDPVDLTDPQWPEIENLRATRQDPAAGLPHELAPQPRPRRSEPGPRDYTAAEDPDEGHFVPPEPPPLPPADTTAKFAWMAVLGGPALLLFDALVWREVSGWPAWVGVAAFLGGFATLVARMKDRDDDEPEDPTGGAVV
ncbi:hypothetical protein AB0D08_01415 [Kitasatospora sp. NPDC048540]|uniref:hypothetical protein n=1 Tax=unclassified Kitasatospora TaxID=2633591 RepID=UPI000A4BBD26|nr:hypothetical protein [Kitasatospora sp. MBT63]